MEAKLSSWWQQIKIHPVRTVLIALLAIVIVLIILSIFGYIFNWSWTGLGPYISPPHPKDSDFQRGKTLWDWLQLLIIPAVLAVAGYVINLTISRGEQAATEQRAKSESEAAEKRATTEREIAQDNQREAALQKYIDNMSELLLKEHLGELKPEYKLVRNVARVRTISVLTQLDARRIGYVFAFLREAGLMSATSNDNVVSLSNADFRSVNWSQAIIFQADLSRANLYRADLSYAVLVGTILNRANLYEANLSYALLIGADLYEADLTSADLTSANLTSAIVTEEQLKKAASLRGATMPDGSIHP